MSVVPTVASFANLNLIAPLSGLLVPLEDVPDPVFAQKMAGDGISIDPTSSELMAPVDGTVSQVHRAGHALAITTAEGIEVLMHVGLDTVTLKGDGFRVRVKVGEKVRAGQVLLDFDPVAVGRKAKSLLTQVLIANGEKLSSLKVPASGLVKAGKDVILVYTLAAPGVAAAAPGLKKALAVLSGPIRLPNHAGLHARPAAVLAQAAKRFTSDLRLLSGASEVNARSMVAILGLGARFGDNVRVKAVGTDARQAVDALAQLLASGCGEGSNGSEESAGTPPPAFIGTSRVAAGPVSSADRFMGVAASPGIAVGKIWRFKPQAVEVSEFGMGPKHERPLLDGALRAARTQLEEMRSHAGSGPKAAILAAHLELLEDPDLEDPALELVQSGKSAGFAWERSYMDVAARLESISDPRFKERAGDIRDVGRRVLLLISGTQKSRLEVPEGSVLLAEELSPSDAAQLDPSKVRGLCTTTGGATSHVAILARSLDLPAVCGVDRAALDLPDGTLVTLDGSSGVVRANPGEAEVVEAHARIASRQARRIEESAAAHREARTKDGGLVEVAANISNAADARAAVAAGADGVGLMRTEFLFDERSTAPTEAEQSVEYKAIAEALGRKRKLVIRTLDAGGDKPLAYLPLPAEDNPFLGMRGLRACLEHPEILRTQLRAMLAAAPLGDLHVMFPMVASVEELKAAKDILHEEERTLGFTAKVGVMIEVPSAALCADALAAEADFFSIGTNDLTQYCLAMDRGHPKLAQKADALHPGVLKLIALAVEGAHGRGRWVGVCGGLASDVLAVPVLVGLGVDELSVSIPAVAAVKARIASLDKGACVALAKELLALGSAVEVRARLERFA